MPSNVPESRFRRVVLKLSGEAFADTSTGFGIDAQVVQRIAQEVGDARHRLAQTPQTGAGGNHQARFHRVTQRSYGNRIESP